VAKALPGCPLSLAVVEEQRKMKTLQSRYYIPVVIGPNRLRGNAVGAMIYDEIGESHLQTLRQALAQEARAAQVEPREDWLRKATAQVLRLYEEAYDDFKNTPREEGVIGFVYEATFPSGASLIMTERSLMNIAAQIKSVEDQRSYHADNHSGPLSSPMAA